MNSSLVTFDMARANFYEMFLGTFTPDQLDSYFNLFEGRVGIDPYTAFDRAVLVALTAMEEEDQAALSTLLSQCAAADKTTSEVIYDVMFESFGSKFSKSEISDTLLQFNYDLDAASEELSRRLAIQLQGKKPNQAERCAEKKKGRQKAKSMHQFRPVDSSRSFASMAATQPTPSPPPAPSRAAPVWGAVKPAKSVSVPPPPPPPPPFSDASLNNEVANTGGRNQSTKVILASACASEASLAASSQGSSGVGVELGSALDLYSEAEWLRMAGEEKAAMIREYRGAMAARSASGRRPEENSSWAAFQSCRGFEAKQRMLKAEFMAAALTARRVNPHLDITVATVDTLGDGPDCMTNCMVIRDIQISRTILAVDLHGLIVRHAVEVVDALLRFIAAPQQRQRLRANAVRTLSLIVGRGSHSKDGISRLKPCICKLLHTRGMCFKQSDADVSIAI